MSDVWAANYTILKQRWPVVADVLASVAPSPQRRAVVNSRGVCVVQHEQTGRWLNLTSAYDPVGEAVRQVARADIASARHVFVAGEAGLYHLEAALQAASSDSRVYLISACPEYLRAALEARDMADALLDPRLVLIVDDDVKRIRSQLHVHLGGDTFQVPTFAWVFHPVEAAIQRSFFDELTFALYRSVQTVFTNQNTTAFFERAWTRNFLCNLPAVLSGVSVYDLANTWRGKPAIVIGAGPSLNKNIHLLGEFRDRALLLSTDTAYRALQRNGICPDVIVTLDGGDLNALNMEGCTYEDIPLLMEVCTHRDIVRHSRAGKVLVAGGTTYQGWLDEITGERRPLPVFDTGGSCATAAFAFARLLGADPVILVGEDLSYPGGACYAEGTANASRTVEQLKGRKLYEVEDIFGQTVYTTYDYLYYLRWFEDAAKVHDRTYIDATEGGARKRGYEVRTLSDCLPLCPRRPEEAAEWRGRLQPRTLDGDRIQHTRARLRRSRLELRCVARLLAILARYGQDYLDALEAKDPVCVDKATRAIARGQARLSSHRLAMRLLDAYSYRTLFTDVQMAEEIQRKRQENDEDNSGARLVAAQTVRLFLDLRLRALDAAEMHLDAYSYFDTYPFVTEEGDPGHVSERVQAGQRADGHTGETVDHAVRRANSIRPAGD
ncbi:motility associated factor glycosyltransferase family protein [Alicyclobacillus macrosporangiidus]|uniref:motility associated factor glycosyltransferase family protein n=1 Tax=Alicyclobacillus macrosporangiidus TaxID=392015 RepID=UPI0004965C19|nr:6-hydroxymethylpterin diphosphokinase MptE-like protein [Alicyclobacillus macrosporangiidus]